MLCKARLLHGFVLPTGVSRSHAALSALPVASAPQTQQDVRTIRRVLDEAGGQQVQIISKIENEAGLENFDDILKVGPAVLEACLARRAVCQCCTTGHCCACYSGLKMDVMHSWPW